MNINSARSNRDNIQIICDVLGAASEGSKKTHIMYKANLSYKLLSTYLDSLVKAGLLRINGDSVYELTDVGRSFLALCKKYEARKKRIGESLNSLRDFRRRLEKILNQ